MQPSPTTGKKLLCQALTPVAAEHADIHVRQGWQANGDDARATITDVLRTGEAADDRGADRTASYATVGPARDVGGDMYKETEVVLRTV